MEISGRSGAAAASKGDALLLLGCPEVPVQTSVALYLCYRLEKVGIKVTVAGTGAALKLMKFADPEGHYLGETVNLDLCIGDIVEGRRDFDLCFAFAHSDAGITYAGTMSHISHAKLFLLIFGRGAKELAQIVDFECEKLVAKAVHNPMPLKKHIDEVINWVASRT